MDTVNNQQKDSESELPPGYIELGDEYLDDTEYNIKPRKRKYAEATIRGVVIGRGENRQVIPLEQVTRLASLNCSYRDMAKFFGVKEQTFRDHFRREVEQAREEVKHRLMEAMLTTAISNLNPTIQIWLSKNLLGMADQPQNTENNQPLPWSDE